MDKDVASIMELGFGRDEAVAALEACKGSVTDAIDRLVTQGSPSAPIHIPPLPAQQQLPAAPVAAATTTQSEDDALQKAIQESLATASSQPVETVSAELQDQELSRAIEASLRERSIVQTFGFVDPPNPHNRKRQPGMPVGLRNVGNTCFFGSLLQSYFFLPSFRDLVFAFRPTQTEYEALKRPPGQPADQSVLFMHALQRLFAMMAFSHRKYVDPSPVLQALRDDKGDPVVIGEQQDTSEFNHLFLQRIEDALNWQYRIQGVEPPESNEIKRMFVGSMSQRVESQEQDGQPVVVQGRSEFGQMILDIDRGDLYQALDEYTDPTEIDYVTEKGHASKGKKSQALEVVPPFLTVQLQRVKYDIEQGIAIKVHDALDFEPVIFVDRYLQVNLERARSKRVEIDKYRAALAMVDESLSAYTHFKATPVSVMDLLAGTSAYLSESPELAKGVISAADVQAVDAVLNRVRGSVAATVSELESQRRSAQNQIDTTYCDMRNHPYRLHAVLVHEGQAKSGHYWLHLYEPVGDRVGAGADAGGRWLKFDDTIVSVVTEQEMMGDARGGKRSISAYCLFFVGDGFQSAPPSTPVPATPGSRISQALLDLFPDERTIRLVPRELIGEVMEDNDKFQKELASWDERTASEALQKDAEAFFKEYDAQLDELAKLEGRLEETLDRRLVNLPFFLKVTGRGELATLFVAREAYSDVNMGTALGEDAVIGSLAGERYKAEPAKAFQVSEAALNELRVWEASYGELMRCVHGFVRGALKLLEGRADDALTSMHAALVLVRTLTMSGIEDLVQMMEGHLAIALIVCARESRANCGSPVPDVRAQGLDAQLRVAHIAGAALVTETEARDQLACEWVDVAGDLQDSAALSIEDREKVGAIMSVYTGETDPAPELPQLPKTFPALDDAPYRVWQQALGQVRERFGAGQQE